MTEDNLNDQPTEEQKLPDETQVKYREISDEKLKQILEDHKKWLESDGKEGERADLEKANLQRVSLLKVNLQMAKLYKANLQEAKLYHANLQGTNLYKADMQNAAFEDVKNLNEATLRYAIMEGATGLLGNEFSQADVTGTKLPDDIKEFKALETVKDTSQNARKIFFAILLGCVYSWLTIATTTDVRLLTNTASSPLPIIGAEIPIVWFYIVAPLVLIALYLFFHFYLQGLWESLSSLPAIFPDGKRLDERAYPWLLNRLVRKHFRLLKDDRPNMAKLQELVIIVLAWWVVPITLVGFWLRYLVRHEFIGTSIHIVLLILLITSSFIFYNFCKFNLQGKDVKTVKLKDFWYKRNSYWVFIIGYILILISNYGFSNWGANFREEDVSIKPGDYYKIESVEKQIESVKGANLKGRNLNKSDMTKSFLVKADLRDSSLNSAMLSEANLQKAILERAQLQQANLEGANLRQAKLVVANLQEAILQRANLQQANLEGANLKEAILERAQLQQANLEGANLQQANLEGANLQEAILERAQLQQANLEGANLQEAILERAQLQQANLQRANLQQAKLSGANFQEANFFMANLQHAKLSGANFQEANFFMANLQQSDLRGANLQQADLSRANLEKANLIFANLHQAFFGIANLVQANLKQAYLKEADFDRANLQQASFNNADLLGVKNLTIDQLSKVKTLYKAKLDPELLEQVKKCCPHLLEEPKEEKDKKDENKINQ